MNQQLLQKIEVALAEVGLKAWQPETGAGYEVAASGDDVLVMPVVTDLLVEKKEARQRENHMYDLIKHALDSASLHYDEEKGELNTKWAVVKSQST